MALAAATAALGLTAMLLSSFPGLSQLGLFSAAGLVTAAVTTRWLLPLLVEDVAHSAASRSRPAGSRRLPLLRRRRAWLAGVVADRRASTSLARPRAGAGSRDLANLSAVPQQARDLDEELRRQLGAPDVRHLVAISGATAEERAAGVRAPGAAARRAHAAKAIGGAELPSRYLPSQRTQLARQQDLPAATELAERVAAAVAGTAVPADGVRRVPKGCRDTARATAGGRRRLHLAAARRTAGAAAVRAREESGTGSPCSTDVARPGRCGTRSRQLGDANLVYMDLKAEMEQMVTSYTREALGWLALGGGLLLVVLFAALRRPALVLRVAAPIACAVLVTLAVLDLLGIRLTLFHLAALLLMTGVSTDYALFLNQGREASADDDSRTLGSVLNCNATTLLTFGLLAFCRNPVLQGIGVTVAIGVLVGDRLCHRPVAAAPRR